MLEEWRPVAGYEESYEVSNLGRIRRVRPINPTKKVKGYMRVNLVSEDGSQKSFALHRLVADAFVPNPDGKPVVIHKDDDASNNRADNLEWAEEKDGTKRGTPVVQIDQQTGEVVAEYRSQAKAAAATGITRPSITACITGRVKTAGGYIWQYKDTKKRRKGNGGKQHEAQG